MGCLSSLQEVNRSSDQVRLLLDCWVIAGDAGIVGFCKSCYLFDDMCWTCLNLNLFLVVVVSVQDDQHLEFDDYESQNLFSPVLNCDVEYCFLFCVKEA